MLNIEVLADNLAELLTSVINTTTKFYDLFVTDVPKDVTIWVFNDENKLVTQTIPNLAKARQCLYGQGTPEGNVTGSVGQFYVDVLNSNKVYVKTTEGVSATGWTRVVTGTVLDGALDGYVPVPKCAYTYGAGTISLMDHHSYKTVTSGEVTYVLPSIPGTDLDKTHFIDVQLKVDNPSHVVNLGASYYLIENNHSTNEYAGTPVDPDMGLLDGSSGLYDLHYEYDCNAEAWGVRVTKKVAVS